MIPSELLKQANIPGDADIQIFKVERAIAICREPVLNAQELRRLLQTLSLAADLADEPPENLVTAQNQLENALNEFMGERLSMVMHVQNTESQENDGVIV